MSNSKNTRTVTDGDFDNNVLKAPSVTLVDFWAEWCGPCKALAPVIDALADEHVGKINVMKLDIDSNPLTAQKYGIKGIPTVLVFKNGQVVDRVVGAQPKDAFNRVIATHTK